MIVAIINWPTPLQISRYFLSCPLGWLGGAMVLCKLPVPGHPSNLADSRARAYCACREAGVFFLDILLSSIFSLLFLPLFWEMARYRLKCCLKGPLNPKQPTNQLSCPVCLSGCHHTFLHLCLKVEIITNLGQRQKLA